MKIKPSPWIQPNHDWTRMKPQHSHGPIQTFDLNQPTIALEALPSLPFRAAQSIATLGTPSLHGPGVDL